VGNRDNHYLNPLGRLSIQGVKITHQLAGVYIRQKWVILGRVTSTTHYLPTKLPTNGRYHFIADSDQIFIYQPFYPAAKMLQWQPVRLNESMFCVTGQGCQDFDNPDYLFSFQHFQPLQVLFLLFLLFPVCSPRYPWGLLNSTGCYSFASRAIPVLNSSGLGATHATLCH